jgi:hypothetical protein
LGVYFEAAAEFDYDAAVQNVSRTKAVKLVAEFVLATTLPFGVG